jgi:hypothetical protein
VQSGTGQDAEYERREITVRNASKSKGLRSVAVERIEPIERVKTDVRGGVEHVFHGVQEPHRPTAGPATKF